MNVEEFWSTAENGRVALNNFLFKKWLEHNKLFKNYPNQRSDFNFIKKDKNKSTPGYRYIKLKLKKLIKF